MNPAQTSAGRPTPRLILASASPRRAALLREHGYDFTVVVPPHEEPTELEPGMTPTQLAEALSRFKAESVASLAGDAWVIAGDTVVALGGRVFGKPADRDDARRILSALSGTTHEVITGVTLLDPFTGRSGTDHDITHVTMKPLSAPELEAYLDSGEWEGKAGAYGIQDCGDAFVVRFEGSFSNVVGFPMELVRRMLERVAWRQSLC